MVTRPEVQAAPRTVTGKAVSRLRREGLLPAVVYGHGEESQPIQMDAHAFDLLRRHAGRNALLDLRLDGGRARPVMVHGIQEHPVTRRVAHVDFMIVKMTEEMTVDVPVVTVGESVAVDKAGGTLLHLMDTIKVRALPADLPQTVELDITPLVDFDVVLHVSDLPIPAGVTLISDPAEAVLRVQAPRLEEEPIAAEAAPEEAAEPAEGEGGEAAAAESGSDS